MRTIDAVTEAPDDGRYTDKAGELTSFGGQAGVARAIEILHKELDVTMALCGVKSIKEIDHRVLADYDERRNARG